MFIFGDTHLVFVCGIVLLPYVCQGYYRFRIEFAHICLVDKYSEFNLRTCDIYRFPLMTQIKENHQTSAQIKTPIEHFQTYKMCGLKQVNRTEKNWNGKFKFALTLRMANSMEKLYLHKSSWFVQHFISKKTLWSACAALNANGRIPAPCNF